MRRTKSAAGLSFSHRTRELLHVCSSLPQCAVLTGASFHCFRRTLLSSSSSSSRERTKLFHSFFDGRGAPARASKLPTQSSWSGSLYGGLYHRYVRRTPPRRRRRRRSLSSSSLRVRVPPLTSSRARTARDMATRPGLVAVCRIV